MTDKTSRNTPSPDTQMPDETKRRNGSSPKYTRLHEKEDLANLNNRLACYIDRVRHLETENCRLTHEIKSIHETVVSEVNGVKSLYEAELAEARRLLDELAREKAKIQIDTQRIFTENGDLRSVMNMRETEINDLRIEVNVLESRLTDITNKLNFLNLENKKLADSNKSLVADKNKVMDELTSARKTLEEEILQRVDLENSLQTLKEESAFNESLLKKQLLEAKKKIDLEKTEIDGKLNQEFEERLCRSLQEIRDQYESDLEDNKEEIKKLYEDKLKNYENQLSRTSNVASRAMSDLKNMQSKVDKLMKEIKKLESERNSAVSNLRELEKKLDEVKSDYLLQYTNHEAEIKKMREKMSLQNKEYEELMDVKVALDMEISAFRKLIECEEARLNITPVTSPDVTARRILKGKRRFNDFNSSLCFSSTPGSIVISELSYEGKYIKIFNNSNDDVSISKWSLIQKVGDTSATYKFGSKLKIPPESPISVWSSNVSGVPTGREHIKMEGQNWLPSEHMVVYLVNLLNEEVASAELSKVTSSSSRKIRAQRRSQSASTLSLNSTIEEKCIIQ